MEHYQHAKPLFIYYKEVPPVTEDESMFSIPVLSNTKTKEVYKKVYAWAKENYANTYFFARIPYCWWNPNDKQEAEISKQVVSHCHIINGLNIIVDVNGKVMPCTHWLNQHSMNLVQDGKVIDKKTFLEEWHKGAPRKLRDKLRYYPSENCKICPDYGSICTGGCPLIPFELGPYAPKHNT